MRAVEWLCALGLKTCYTDHVGFNITNPNGCEGFYGGGPMGGVYT